MLEIIQKLLDDGLAVMEPNDPARELLKASLTISANEMPMFCVRFYSYAEKPSREAFGYGNSPDEALEEFNSKYIPPLTREMEIKELETKLAALKGAQS